MADSNTALVALGLDTSQFAGSMDKAVGSTNALLQAAVHLDTELRKIPIIGDLWALTFGHISQGLAETTLQSREFARIMSADVGTSLEGTRGKIEEINAALKQMREGSFSRGITDFFTNLFHKSDFLAGKSPQATRARQDEELAKKRQEMQSQLVALYKQQAAAQSEIYSGSVLASDNARIEMEYAERIAQSNREAFQMGGPERDKWDKQVIKNLELELKLAQEIKNIEQSAAQKRAESRIADFNQAVSASFWTYAGNQRDAAAEELKYAMQNKARLEFYRASEDEKRAAEARLDIAKNGVKLAEQQYQYATAQAALETSVMELEISGQTRATNQAKIRAQYETEIAKQRFHGNEELAVELEKQQKLAKLQEDIRLYKLGAGGRASERARERHEAQIVRIVEAQQRTRAQGQHGGGLLATGGLISGHAAEMDRKDRKFSEQKKKAESTLDKQLTILDLIEQHLR